MYTGISFIGWCHTHFLTQLKNEVSQLYWTHILRYQKSWPTRPSLLPI